MATCEFTKNALETYRTLLEEQGVSLKTSHHPNALCLDIPIAVQKLPHFEEGAVTVQDLSAQWAAMLLEPKMRSGSSMLALHPVVRRPIF